MAQRVGQLFMAGCSSNGECQDVGKLAGRGSIGSVILMDTTYRSVDQIAALTARLRAAAAPGPELYIATDQEGGQVLRLRGHGFAHVPAATEQGLLEPSTLRQRAQSWGADLHRAGLNLNLSPVLDTVPAGTAGNNPPIGALQRQFGSDPLLVSRSGGAVVEGYRSAGVDSAVKHFPGLGRVHANTDTTAGVRDDVTTEQDPYLVPFRDAVERHVAFVMISTAIYTRIDAGGPAAFSHTVITELLRQRLGFGGVVISDDLANAAQVRQYSAGQRALRFLAAGGDMVLTVDSSLVKPMAAAVLARMRSDPEFASTVNAAVLRILQAKQNRRLLS